MRRGIFAVVVATALALAAPAGAAVQVHPVPEDGVATCLRDAGAGGLLALQGPVTQTTTPTDLLLATPERVERATGADLGRLAACPEVAIGGDTTVIAGVTSTVEGWQIRAAVRTGQGDFSAAETLDTAATEVTEIAVAAGPRGDAVVVWRELRGDTISGDGEVRILAARRLPGPDASWGAVEEVVPWTAQPDELSTRLPGFPGATRFAAGVDGSGRTTVAWAIGRKPRGRVSGLSDLGVSTAAVGEPLQRVTLERAVQDVSLVELAVAPDGKALLAIPLFDRVLVRERTSADGSFAPLPDLGGGQDAVTASAAVALRPDGAAVIAWNYSEELRAGVRTVRRDAGGSFGAPTEVWSRSRRSFESFTSFGLLSDLTDPPVAPIDTAQLRVVLTASGRVAMTWPEGRRVAEDLVPGVMIATGGLAGDFSVTRRGSNCRGVNGAAPFELPNGDTGAAWTDNAGYLFGPSPDVPSGTGRLHVATPADATPGNAPPPRANLVASRRTQRLWAEDPIEVELECDGPCDARVFAPGDEENQSATAVTLPTAGRTRVRLYPAFEPLASRTPSGRTVLVHACSPDGTAHRRDKVRVMVVRRRPPPLPALVGVRARRAGDQVVVTWRTTLPARRANFQVAGLPSRRATPPLRGPFADVTGRGRTRFRARLDLQPGQRVRYVRVLVYSVETGRTREATVPVGR